jgi:hypothetical protein
MQMIMLVLNNPDKLDDVLDAWHEAGIGGATVMESTGIYRRRPGLMGARYAFGFPPITNMTECGHFTLFTIVNDAQMVERCYEATQSVIGDLTEPNTGIMAAWQVDQAWGERRQFGRHEGEDLP